MNKPRFNLSKLVTALSAVAAMATLTFTGDANAVANIEKDSLKFGFIKLTDMAPLAVAFEKGFFEEEGLYVQLEAQANWKVVMDRVVNGELNEEQAKAEIRPATRVFVRRQANWFKESDPNITWLQVSERTAGEIEYLIRSLIDF